MDYSEYHPDWKTKIRPDILKSDEYTCQGWRLNPSCGVVDLQKNEETGKREGLHIAHLDQDKNNNNYENLRALCVRCHAGYDGKYKDSLMKYGKNWRENQLKLIF